jgi:SAM-dependent methyltransferase
VIPSPIVGWTVFDRRGWRALVPRSTWPDARPLQEALRLLGTGAAIVDLGAGGRRVAPHAFTVDAVAATSPDLVCDLHRIPLEDGRFDGAVCTGTLEHVRDPEQVGREIVRLLKEGGLAYIDVPFLQGFHADPDDFRRWTLPGLRLFCERLGLEVLSSGVHIGPGSALSWVASEYARVLFGGLLGRAASVVIRTLLTPLQLLDQWLSHRRDAARIASGVYAIARKRAS